MKTQDDGSNGAYTEDCFYRNQPIGGSGTQKWHFILRHYAATKEAAYKGPHD